MRSMIDPLTADAREKIKLADRLVEAGATRAAASQLRVAARELDAAATAEAERVYRDAGGAVR